MSREAEREIALRIDTAYQEDRLSEGALDALKRAPSINLDLGTSARDFDPDEVLLVTLMPDDSTSLNRIVTRKSAPPASYSFHRMLEGETSRTNIAQYDIMNVEPENPRANAEAIRTGHNAVLEALTVSPRPDQIVLATRFLNGFLLNPYGPLEKAQRLDTHNFRPNRGTPLYDQTVELLKMILAKSEQFRADYKEPRTATLLVTDGKDEHSRIQTATSVAEVIKSMRGTGQHIIAAMGIDDGKTDFRKVFTDMGIDSKWILTPGSTKEEIQEAFGLFAKTASQATKASDFPLLLSSGFEGITKT